MKLSTFIAIQALQLAAFLAALVDGSSSASAYGTNFFVDTANTYYDGYQQAWRYLGWYVKCGYPSDRYDEEESGDHEESNQSEDHDDRGRKLSGSGDDNRWQGSNYCQRYLIWAAYVDEGYQGGGIGEYHYYDPYSHKWDYSACEAHGNGRCAPMDCHISNTTTWKLMGVFKEASYFGNDAFFEQLFKHEGVCLWNDDDLYEFMSDAREEQWTQGCVSTGVKGNDFYYQENDNGNGYLYIDLKPTWNGNMTNGLYIDQYCKTEYEGIDVDVEKVAKNMGLLYGDYLDTWNDALEVYKVCQPCRAYNIENNYDMGYNGDDDGGRRLDGDYSYYDDVNEGYFQCNDDADYTNVNQCMKFRTHAELEVATWEDLVTATNQGGILQVKVGDTIFGSERMSAEQNEYLIMQRRKGLATQARKAKLQAQQVRAMRPEAELWEKGGKLTLSVGVLVLFLSLLRVWCKCRSNSQQRNLAEPLL